MWRGHPGALIFSAMYTMHGHGDFFFGVSAVCFALIALPAHAREDRLASASCETPEALSSDLAAPDTLDPRLRGIALSDLEEPEGGMVSSYLRLPGVLALSEVLSTSIVELRANRLVVDVVGRAARFQDTDDRRNPHGRVGLMRVTVPVATAESRCDVGLPEVQWERSLSELDLRYRVSILDWVAVMEDRALGFRRIFPIGGGGIDRGVRYAGVVSSMTPTTDDGLLEKTYAWRELSSPWYFRGKPYLPISLGRTLTRKNGTTYKIYIESRVAFHVWQDKGFERGFFSHGCMRMRGEDLTELAAFVFGARAHIPVTLRLNPLTDVRHPYPMERKKYWQLKNFGTPAKPETRHKYMLPEMELGTLPLPAPEEFVPMTFDSKPIYAP